MQRNASGVSYLTLAKLSVGRRSVARTCGRLTVRCLEAVAESYLQSRTYNPYWIGPGPLPQSSANEAPQG
jgi:hypothetical protein